MYVSNALELMFLMFSPIVLCIVKCTRPGLTDSIDIASCET